MRVVSPQSSYRTVGVVVGLILFLTVFWLPTPEGLSVPAQRTAAVGALMALWWVGNVLPMAVTALIPLLAFPLLGVASLTDAATPYAHPINVLMLGGFLLGHGMERVGLHSRLAALLLRSRYVRSSARRMLLAIMVAAALLSGLVSNTATTLMLLPLALHLARITDTPTSGFALGLAYAASIGGTVTLIGTPPNAVLAGLPGVEIGFANWIPVGGSFAIVALPLAWLVVCRQLVPRRAGEAVDAPAPPAWRPGERWVLTLIAVAMLLWCTRGPVWSAWVPGRGSELDAGVALLAGLLVFFVPGANGPITTWRDAERALPWSVLILLGGGFSLAHGIRASGLGAWLAGGADALSDLPVVAIVGGTCLGMTFVTELTSNTASTQILLPVLQAAAERLQISPLLLMVPATISASCAFMMPVATAPNAIASEAGDVDPRDMARTGLVLNVVLAGVVTAVGMALVPLFLEPTLP